MKILREALLALVGLLSIGSASRAQNLSLFWSEWETSAVVKQGPEAADAVLLYFHERSSHDVTKNPIMGIFVEMAKAANWDILRINRHPFVDCESSDDDILQIVADRVASVRRDGYKKVIVGGGSGGGRLALLAAALPGVDVAIALAPGTAYGRSDLIRTRDVLAERLARAEAARIAIFFFEGDLLENLEERRSVAIRRGLEKSGASFMIVDHPPDLHGHPAMVTGRLVRRYRDCLLQLVRDAELAAGEFECSRSSGYAVGADIGFPDSAGLKQAPSDTDPTLLPYFGRWEGDDEWGAYFILETIAIESNGIEFGAGWSESVGSGRPARIGRIPFQLDRRDGSIFFRPDNDRGLMSVRLKTPTELEVTFDIPDHNGKVTKRQLLLRKRVAEGTAQ